MSHAKYSPSSAKRWLSCPGSVRASEGLPDPETRDSREGTFAHDIAARALLANKDAKAFLGAFSEDMEFMVDEEMADHIQTYLDFVRGLQITHGGRLLVEQKVRCWAMADESKDVIGTADALLISDDNLTIHVVDLKMGRGVYVPADDNPQLLSYATGAYGTLIRLTGDKAEKGVAHLHIVQPRYRDGGDATRSTEVPYAELSKFRRALGAGILEAEKPDAPLTPGDHCQFCKAKSNCPALRTQALVAAKDVFSDLDTLKPAAPPPVETLTDEMIGKFLGAADAVEQWLKAVRDEAFRRAQAGKPLPGWKLVQKIGNRRWIDEQQAARALTAHGVLDIYEPLSILSPSKIEKATPGAKALVATLTERPVTGVSLVPESDKRPALDPARVFDALPG